MSDFFDEVNLLVGDIVNHNINLEQAQSRINTLKEKYGKDSFSSIYFEKKSEPWDESYLRELKEQNVTGACSEEFLLYMAEVSDYISSKKSKNRTIVRVAVVVVAIVLITVAILFL